MSADNWARCPRCTAQGLARLKEREAAVQALYGAVPVSEFDEARRQLTADTLEFERRISTFRENYEIHGAEDGIVRVRYSGGCEPCGLSLSFNYEHPIPGLEGL